MARFAVITQWQDGTRSVSSYDTYLDASHNYLKACNSVTWYYEATSVRMVDRKQSNEETQHILHMCTTSISY
jgi:hypothetical protein